MSNYRHYPTICCIRSQERATLSAPSKRLDERGVLHYYSGKKGNVGGVL